MGQVNESAFECLKQIPNPHTCQLRLDGCFRYHSLTPSEALKLVGLLRQFKNLIQCRLYLGDCCAEAENELVSSITHKTLQELRLSHFRLTPAIAAALGRSFPEMSSLEKLCLEVWKMKSSLRGCLTPLTECFHFFPCLLRVDLTRSNLDESDLRGLVCSLEPIPNLRSLWLVGNPMGDKNRVESIAKQALPHVGLHY